MRFLNRNALTILLYHGVACLPAGRRRGSSIFNYRGKFIAPEHFEKQLAYFARRYSVLALDDALQRMKNGTLPQYPLVITFDDGYRNFYEHAYPILKKMGLPATMFLATDFVLHRKPLWVDRLEYAGNKENDALKQLPDDERERRVTNIERDAGVSFPDFEDDRSVYAPLAVEEIREMQSGDMTFGAHTKSHPVLSRLTDERAEEEIRGSKEALEQALGPISSVFAYPNGQRGDWNDATERILARNGFTAALTTIEGVNTRDTHPMRLRRMVMDATDDGPAFAAIASGVRLLLNTIRSYVRRR